MISHQQRGRPLMTWCASADVLGHDWISIDDMATDMETIDYMSCYGWMLDDDMADKMP